MGIEEKQNQVVRNLETSQNAPTIPPVVWANEVELSITQFEWISDGGVSSQLVDAPQHAIITDVPLNWPHLSLKFSTSVKPAALVVGLFPDVDEWGFPEIATEISIDSFESDKSSMTFEEGCMTVMLEDITPVKFAVVRVAYTVRSNQGSTGKLSSASWVMRFAGECS